MCPDRKSGAFLLLKPWDHSRDGLFDQRGGDRKAEPDEAMPVDRIEIEAGSRGHARIAKQPLAERKAVVRQMADVGVDVESAIGRCDPPLPLL